MARKRRQSTDRLRESKVLERVAEELMLQVKVQRYEISRNYLFGGIVGPPRKCGVFRIDVYDVEETVLTWKSREKEIAMQFLV